MSVSLAKLVDLYETGFSIREVGKMTGLPYGTVRGRLLIYGVQLRRPGSGRRDSPHQKYAQAAFLYENAGMSSVEISKKLGLAQSTVRNRLHRHGVQMRSRNETSAEKRERRSGIGDGS